MTIRQYLIRSINVLNLTLLAVVAMMFIYVLKPLFLASTAVKIPSTKEESQQLVSDKGGEGEQVMSVDYAVIGENNLFHPDRVIPPEKKMATVKEKVRPDIVLHGTMITDQLKLAYIEDKKASSTSSGRGARQITLKEGDLIGGYKLDQITDKTIVLTNGDEQMVLYLDELKERKMETTGTAKPVTPSLGVNPQSGQGAQPKKPQEPIILSPPFPPPIQRPQAKTN